MRRVLSTVLVSVFSFSLIAPALMTDADSDLPACCRRGGQHHCAMMEMDADGAESSSVPAAKAHAVRCAYFPKGGALLPHPELGLPAVSQMPSAILLSQLTGQSQAEAGYRISLGRSHQKRGPPALLS